MQCEGLAKFRASHLYKVCDFMFDGFRFSTKEQGQGTGSGLGSN